MVPGSTLMYGSSFTIAILRPARLENRAERRAGDALAQRGNDATSDENETGHARLTRNADDPVSTGPVTRSKGRGRSSVRRSA